MHSIDHTENIIEVKQLSFSFKDNEILKDIQLMIHRGDYLGIVGGNGAGKTTLIKTILGLYKPLSGSIKLFGEEISQFKDWHKIGYVPQKVTNFDSNFPATVEEVVLMGRYGKRGILGRIVEEDNVKTRLALEHVGMWQFRDRIIGDLSGGQQQRVFIARALAGEPEIIFLDEPTIGIEKYIKDEFYSLLRKMNRDLHLTVVLVTHDIESMSKEAMHVACLDDTLFFHNSVDEYFKNTHPVIPPHP